MKYSHMQYCFKKNMFNVYMVDESVWLWYKDAKTHDCLDDKTQPPSWMLPASGMEV